LRSLIIVQLPLSTPIQTEFRAFVRLTIPLASAQIAQATTGFIDTIMMGWIGRETLAAGGLATSTFAMLLVTATGVVTGISPLVAEAFGADNKERIQQLAQQGMWITLGISLPIMLLLSQMGHLMPYLGQTKAISTLAKPYLDVMVWGFFPALTFVLLKNIVSSLSQPQPIMVAVALGTGFNAIGNYVLGFGKWGFPNLGLVGIAVATVLAHWIMAAFLFFYILWHKQLQVYRCFQQLQPIKLKLVQELVWLGLPIGVSFGLEVGLFTVTTYLMGILGAEVLAAHQIVFQTIVVVFMVPLGMSFATTIRVGQWVGQQNAAGVQRAAYVSMGLGGMFMTLMAIALLLFPHQVIGLYLDPRDPVNASVVALAIPMLAVAALSQILDGVQTTAAGALRGIKDTRIPMVLSFLAFWGVGLASGYLMGFRLGWGGVGLWLGQCFGVAASAIAFIWRFRQLMSQSLSRIN
jgi:MATE family multidrug resistance protein